MRITVAQWSFQMFSLPAQSFFKAVDNFTCSLQDTLSVPHSDFSSTWNNTGAQIINSLAGKKWCQCAAQSNYFFAQKLTRFKSSS